MRKTLQERFWDKVDKHGPVPKKCPELGRCWTWRGAMSSNGYGSFWMDGRGEAAHRASWFLIHGEFPPTGMDLDHLCRKRGCVNPAHLEVVTRSVNLRRGVGPSRNLQKTHCPLGHAYYGDNLVVYASGSRACRECNKLAVKRYQERKCAHAQK